MLGNQPCGFCRTDTHELCPGAIEAGSKGELWVCPCGCVEARCTRCRSREQIDAEAWRCVDPAECAEAAARRSASDPNMKVIREIMARSAERRPEPRPAAPGAFRPGGGKCECGCGAPTGKRFAMGHDARLRSVLAREFAAGDADAGTELAARGGVWAERAPGVTLPADPDAFVATRVAARLR